MCSCGVPGINEGRRTPSWTIAIVVRKPVGTHAQFGMSAPDGGIRKPWQYKERDGARRGRRWDTRRDIGGGMENNLDPVNSELPRFSVEWGAMNA